MVRRGPIAQSVEQLAFNQWVAGSSPARLINLIKQLRLPIGVAFLISAGLTATLTATSFLSTGDRRLRRVEGRPFPFV